MSRQDQAEWQRKRNRDQNRELLKALLLPGWRLNSVQILRAIGISLAFAVLVIAFYPSGVTLWDWVQLLIVPAAIAGVGIWFSRQQQRREQKIAEQHAQDEALQAYLDQMSQLLIDKDRPLYKARRGDNLSTVARAQTLTTLRRLDGERKRSVVQFLYEAGLIYNNSRVLDLSGADLSQANLAVADLANVDLSGVNLQDADLSFASMPNSNLRQSDLRRSTMVLVFLNEANLFRTSLEGANLGSARLDKAKLHHTYLINTRLRGANFEETDLRNARLRGADLIDTDLRQAIGLSQSQLEEAYGETEEVCGYGVTTLPHGLNPPVAWNQGLEEQKVLLENRRGVPLPDSSR